jgi:chromosome segregation ATPase
MKKAYWLVLALHVSAASAAYKCVDEHGITQIGDVPPAGCANVVIYEVSRSGVVLRKIEPTPTPEQVKVLTAERERRAEAERSAAEQQRKDLALLNTYGSEHEIDVARDRNIEPIRNRIASAHERLSAVEEREKQLADEMEFYKAGKRKGKAKGREPDKVVEAPPSLVAEVQRIAGEKANLHKALEGYDRQIAEVRVRYEADRQRWLALKSGSIAKPARFLDAKAAKGRD